MFQKDETSKYKGPEAAMHQAFLRNNKEINVGAAESQRGLTAGENREMGWGSGRADHRGPEGRYRNQEGGRLSQKRSVTTGNVMYSIMPVVNNIVQYT